MKPGRDPCILRGHAGGAIAPLFVDDRQGFHLSRRTAILALADGSIFRGRGFGADGCQVGEVVFNTAMSGYQEILSDPSYAQQMVVLTYPHIGNVGVNPEDLESSGVQLSGLITRLAPRRPSSWRSEQSLDEWMAAEGRPGICDIDTRRLTRLLRDQGAQNGCLMVGAAADEAEALRQARAFGGLKGADLAQVVTTSQSYSWEEGRWQATPAPARRHVVVVDFGVKRNILRELVHHGCRVTVVPAKTGFEEILALKPDGVMLSNGPGDPEPVDYGIAAARALIERRVPLFGICLGHQILGLAAGAKTLKMKFGHHGANHPVQDLASGQVWISSQNHGFAVDEDSLPAGVTATHRSLFDNSLQGIALDTAPAFSFQGHPEASPGPHDVNPLFARFVAMMDATHA